MYSRSIWLPDDGKSAFLFGPRGVGKSTWLKQKHSAASHIDLLKADVFYALSADPTRLKSFMQLRKSGEQHPVVIIDEIQRVPDLLNEVHRLIESERIQFVLTGSSARKLRTRGTNLLAGRAITCQAHCLTAAELGGDFSIRHALQYGLLPSVWVERDPQNYLASYVQTYIREEVQQEGLTRNLAAFARFLEAASFSQGAVLNTTDVARQCHVERKVVENYFSIVEDLLIATKLPPFTKRAKRDIWLKSKFYYFDAGVYRTLGPQGPLDTPQESDGAALETLILQHLRAYNDYGRHGYTLYYWRTREGAEVDFVMYGAKGLIAIEAKRTKALRPKDFAGLKLFRQDYPMARCILVYGGSQTYAEDGIEVVPAADFLHSLTP